MLMHYWDSNELNECLQERMFVEDINNFALDKLSIASTHLYNFITKASSGNLIKLEQFYKIILKIFWNYFP